jgi:hypothetical protein
VTRIDRLARSIGDLQDIVRAVKAGANLKATEQPIDTSTAADKCFIGVFAELETNLRRERQLNQPRARLSPCRATVMVPSGQRPPLFAWPWIMVSKKKT